MLHSRHIVVADYPNGKTATLYQGESQVLAEKAMARGIAEGKAEAVMIFSHPMPLHVRYPLQEAAEAEARKQEAVLQEKNAVTAKASEAAGKREAAKKLIAEAEALESEQGARPEGRGTKRDA